MLIVCLVALLGSACNSETTVNNKGELIKKPKLISEVDSVRIYYVMHEGRFIYFGVSKNGYVSISTH